MILEGYINISTDTIPFIRTIALHNRFVCKPGRIMALKRFMAYIAEKDDVWVCTRREIAAFWREKYPYKKVGPLYKKYSPEAKASIV